MFFFIIIFESHGFYPYPFEEIHVRLKTFHVWNFWVITVKPFECHVHLNILSFSSAPCFLISSNCPLYKINHFGLTPGGILFCSWRLITRAGSEFRAQSETSWEDHLPLSCVATLNCAARATERSICLVFMRRLWPHRLIYGVLWRSWAGIAGKPDYVCHASRSRLWISDACTSRNSPTQRNASTQVHSCHCWLAFYWSLCCVSKL